MKQYVGFYNYTVIATYIGFGFGMAGIWSAAQGNAFFAALFLLLAGFCDMIDGKIARACKTRSRDACRFGVQIDSLSDMVCFGVLPPMLGWAMGLRHWSQLLLLIAFALCGLIRLAYFNVMTQSQEEANATGHMDYRGLPISTAGLIFPALYAFRFNNEILAAVVYGLFLAVVGFAFIAPFTMKKPGLKVQIPMVLVGVLALVLLFTRG